MLAVIYKIVALWHFSSGREFEPVPEDEILDTSLHSRIEF